MILGDRKKEEHLFYIPIHIPEIGPIEVASNTSMPSAEDEWLMANHLITINQISQHEAPLISLPFSVKLLLTIIMIMSLLSGSYFKSIMYRYVFTTNKKNRGWMHRPINVLTVTSAIIHHVTHVTVGIWFVLVLMIDTPLGSIFGFHCCKIMLNVATYGTAYLTVGSLGIAVYRVLYIRQEYWVKYVIGEKLLLALVLSLSMVVAGLISIFYLAEVSAHRAMDNMCTGVSFTENQILIEYSISLGSQMLTTTYLQGTALTVCIAIQTIEFSIYIWFFCYRYRNDNGTITKLLAQDTIRERNIKNVTTFLGQFYGFVIEYSFLISLMLFTIFAHEHIQHIRGIVVMVKFIDFGLLSAVEVLSSPGLKGFMK